MTNDGVRGPLADYTGFEWDEEKRTVNIRNHNIDFVDALEIFSDENALILKSQGQHAEQRYLVIGRMRTRTITVVITRRGSAVRLISARIARRNERQQYGSEK